jgi:hypothetical protein
LITDTDDLQRSAGVQSADRDNPNVFDAPLRSAGRVLRFGGRIPANDEIAAGSIRRRRGGA